MTDAIDLALDALHAFMQDSPRPYDAMLGQQAIDALRAALAAPPVDPGWVLVPVEPTLAMGWAYLDAANENEPLRRHLFNWAGYRAMLAAAPGAPDAQPKGMP